MSSQNVELRWSLAAFTREAHSLSVNLTMPRVTSEFVHLLKCFSTSPVSVVCLKTYGDLEHFWLNLKTSLRVQLSKCECDDSNPNRKDIHVCEGCALCNLTHEQLVCCLQIIVLESAYCVPNWHAKYIK